MQRTIKTNTTFHFYKVSVKQIQVNTLIATLKENYLFRISEKLTNTSKNTNCY